MIDFEIEDIVPFGVETGEPVRFSGMFHPVGLRPDDGGGEAVGINAFGIAVRGEDRIVEVRTSPGLPDCMTESGRAAARQPVRRPSIPRTRPPALSWVWSLVLIALAGVGWWWTIRQMRGMDNGPWTGLGTFGWFISVWIVMMAAMMFPSVAPTVALYARMSRKPLAPMCSSTGYLLTWTGAGVVAFLVGRARRSRRTGDAGVGARRAAF